jgi:hypothetical protein
VAPDWLGDQENVAMLSDRRSTGRFVTSLKLCHLVRLMANTPTALVLLVSEASYAAQRTIEWFSEESCRYKIRFDPKKNDVTRIKNTCVVSDTTKNLFSANNFIRGIPALRAETPMGVVQYTVLAKAHQAFRTP